MSCSRLSRPDALLSSILSSQRCRQLYRGRADQLTSSLKTVYADPRFWRLAPLSATCIGTAWALQGLWAAPWLSDVERLDRPELLQHLLVMAIALSLGALLWGVAVDRLRRHGVGPRALLGLVATIFIAAQLALILRLPLPSYVPWIVVAAVGAGTVLSYAILAEYFPTELAGRANAALNLFHIGGAFVVQYMTGLVVQLWAPTDGHYPEIAYQTAFAFNVGLQIAAAIWFALTWVRRETSQRGETTLSPLISLTSMKRNGFSFIQSAIFKRDAG